MERNVHANKEETSGLASHPKYEHTQIIAEKGTRPQSYCRKSCRLRLEARLVVDMVGDVTVDPGTSSSNNIALGDNVVRASGAESNRARNSAVVNVADTESLLVDAHELTRSRT
jgi:hypothetical protein